MKNNVLCFDIYFYSEQILCCYHGTSGFACFFQNQGHHFSKVLSSRWLLFTSEWYENKLHTNRFPYFTQLMAVLCFFFLFFSARNIVALSKNFSPNWVGYTCFWRSYSSESSKTMNCHFNKEAVIGLFPSFCNLILCSTGYESKSSKAHREPHRELWGGQPAPCLPFLVPFPPAKLQTDPP